MKIIIGIWLLFFIIRKGFCLESFETKIISGALDQRISEVVNSSVQFIFHYKDLADSGLRVHTTSSGAHEEQPVLIVVRQEKGVLSWQIPFFVKRDDYTNDYDKYYTVNRTLCPIENNPKLLSKEGDKTDVYITVSSASLKNVGFSILLYRQDTFYINRLNQTLTTQVSPSEPIFFQLDFPKDEDSVLVKVTSPDESCAILSIQNVSCPVYDLDLNVQFEGDFMTLGRKAGLAVTKDKYPLGAYIIFVAKTDDAACRNSFQLTAVSPVVVFDRTKTIQVEIQSLISNDEYFIATFGAIGIFLGFYALVLLISCALCIKDYRMGVIEDDRQSILSASVEASGQQSENRLETIPEEENTDITRHRHNAQVNGDPVDRIEVLPESPVANEDTLSNDSSIDEIDIDFLLDAELEKDVFRTKTFLFVSDLARKSNRVLAKKSALYKWNLMTIAIFYGLPVVQLVLTYQSVTNRTGNQDMCYYNFLCAHPLGLVRDFNHVFSNLGYVLLGILFIFIVSRKEYLHQKLPLEHRKKFGIPQHFGMYYSMGLALIMEGIMSGCYHVCPNHTNFQFDTAFMYTISILILLKIYQTRHPDINANAYTAFGVLAFIIFLGVIGVLHGNIYFWLFFAGLHCLSCLILSFQIYYMGRWRVDAGIFKRVWLVFVNDIKAVIGGNWRGLKPMYVDRFFLLVVLNAVNWSLSGYGVIKLAGQGADFASFMLAIFIGNVMLYTMFYIVMKLRYKETIGAQPAAYILISTFTWCGAMYFFLAKSTSWTKTPAESRELNMDCQLFHFYDNHDIWHFLSATSLFLSFMILLTLDDDLENIPRDKIPVF